MKRIIITGASGFFGRSVVDALTKTDDQFKCFCVYKSNQFDIPDPRFSWVRADLLDHSTHNSLMRSVMPTDIVHLAWDVPPKDFWHSLKNVDWLHASISLFDAFCASGGTKFIGAGSGTEYAWESEVLNEEKSLLKPNSLYGECKRSLCAILEKIQKKEYSSTILIWARIGYFFGREEPQGKLISKLIHGIFFQEPLKVVESNVRRPYAHVKYAGKVLAHALLNQKENLIFNLSGSTSYAIKDVVDFIGTRLQKSTSCVLYGAYKSPIEESRNLKFDTQRLETLMGSNIPDTFYDDLERILKNVI